MSAPPVIRFTEAEAHAAHDAWGFNCGPAALCGVLGLRPEQVRPHLLGFEERGYTNPTLMYDALRSLGVTFTKRVTPADSKTNVFPRLGLVRVQWAGPWTQPGVPMRARYRKTHWVGTFWSSPPPDAPSEEFVFDINAAGVGGWIRFDEWSLKLVPWLLKQCEPKADGEWWITHSLEVER